MQIEYKKEWMDTFLWILPDNYTEESYEERMLKFNSGGGRLEFSREQKDGEDYFCYKVTGKKALNSIYAVMPIGERQIRRILRQLFQTLEDGREFLLCEEDFLLQPNYIFATFPQMDLEFCYVPGYGVPLREQLESLFEYLLNRVDYEDKPAVNLLYDCYMFCVKEKGGLAEIRKRLEEEEEEVLPKPSSQNPVQEEEWKLPATERAKTGGWQKRTEKQEIESGWQKRTEKQEAGGGWQKQTEKQETENRRGKKQEEKGSSYMSWLTGHLRHFRKPVAFVAEEEEPYESRRGNPVPMPMHEEMERTVLLSAVKQPETMELVCEQTGEVIPVTKFPFYIGSVKEYADFVPAAEGVSRIHCSISKKEDNYYLADLNSTNGTYLNKQEVIPGKEVLLSAQDELRICSQEFYIKFPCH